MAELEPNDLQLKPRKRRVKPAVKAVAAVASVETKQSPVEEEEPEACSICCRHYTKYMRCKIKCLYCEQITCKECCKNYFLNKSTTHCIHCKKIMNEDFLYENFPKTWVNTELIQHQSNIIFEQQKAMLPETSKEIYQEELQTQIERQRVLVDNIEYKVRNHQAILSTRVSELSEYARTVMENLTKTYELELKKLVDLSEHCTGETVIKSNQPCLKPNCKGFCRFDHLKEELSCMVCKHIFCSLCYVEKKQSHTCDPEQVKTIAMVRKDTKHCPNCKELIYKISGCDQMFCTACNTCFSWETGEVDKGRVHNPHYFEYQMKMKQQKGGANEAPVPAPPAVVDGDCIDFRNLNQVLRILGSKANLCSHEQYQYLHNLIQFMGHIHGVEMRANEDNNPDFHRKNRMNYIRNHISDEYFKQLILQRELRRRKMFAKYCIFDMLHSVLGDILVGFLSQNQPMTNHFQEQVKNIVVYFNKQQRKLAQTFSETNIVFINPEEPFRLQNMRNTKDVNLDIHPSQVRSVDDTWMNEMEIRLFTIYEQEKVWLKELNWNAFFMNREEDLLLVSQGPLILQEEGNKRNRTMFCERAFELITTNRLRVAQHLFEEFEENEIPANHMFQHEGADHIALMWLTYHPLMYPFTGRFDTRLDRYLMDSQNEFSGHMLRDNVLLAIMKKYLQPVVDAHNTGEVLCKISMMIWSCKYISYIDMSHEDSVYFSNLYADILDYAKRLHSKYLNRRSYNNLLRLFYRIRVY
jgi:hypothetical protein